MALINDLLKSLAVPVGDLAKWLEEEHNIPVNQTIQKWNEITGMSISIDEKGSLECSNIPAENQIVHIQKQGTPTPIPTPKPDIKNLDPRICQHIFLAGARKGQQCTTKPKGGANRCGAHKLKEKPTKIDSTDSESDPKKPSAKNKDNKIMAKTRPKKKTLKIVSTDSESDSESDSKKPSTESEEDSKIMAKPQPKKKTLKIVSTDSESDSESDSENDPKKPSTESEEDSKIMAKPQPKKKTVKNGSTDSESDSKKTIKKKSPVKKSPVKKSPAKKILVSDSESESESESD